MRNDYTHITVILDRTGSMQAIREDTIGGFNAFLREQKQNPGKATFTLVQFDSQNPYEIIHDFKDVKDVTELDRKTFVPRASTPLFDAMGRGINDLESKLSSMPDALKPSKVIIVVVTDGQENSSREFSKAKVSEMIKDKQNKEDWQFVFLSADLKAMDEAISTGVSASSAMLFDKTANGIANAWNSLSNCTHLYRGGKSTEVSFSDDDRAKQNIEKKKRIH